MEHCIPSVVTNVTKRCDGLVSGDIACSGSTDGSARSIVRSTTSSAEPTFYPLEVRRKVEDESDGYKVEGDINKEKE